MMPVLLRESNPRKQDRSHDVLMTHSQKSHTIISAVPYLLHTVQSHSVWERRCEYQEMKTRKEHFGGRLVQCVRNLQNLEALKQRGR